MLPVLVMSALMAQAAPPLPSVTPPAASAAAPSAAPAPAQAQAAAPAPAPAMPAPVAAPPVAAVAPAPAPVAAPQPPARPSMIKVDAYHEKAGDRTDSNIWSAFNARQSESGPMAGTWVVTSAEGRKLVSFELRDDGADHKLEGAWRSLTSDVGLTGSGFVSDLYLDGPALEINYATGRAHAPNVLELRKGADGDWRGVLLDPAGHRTEVTMSHAVHTG